jgi:hypothetical protein
MSFSAFSSFLHKLAFQRSKSQLKSLPFVSAFGFSTFRLKKPAEKRKRTGLKASVVRDVSLRDDMDLDGGQLSMEVKINIEKMARLAEMFVEAHEEILNRTNPKLVEMLNRQGREKSREKKGADRGLQWGR